MQNPATPYDLEKRGFSPDSPSATVQQTRLDEAWRALTAEIPSIPARIEANMLDTDVVIDTVVAAALRVLRNPEGIVRAGYSIDDWREDRQLSNASEDVYFTAAELRRLRLPDVTAGSMKYS